MPPSLAHTISVAGWFGVISSDYNRPSQISLLLRSFCTASAIIPDDEMFCLPHKCTLVPIDTKAIMPWRGRQLPPLGHY